MTILSLGDTTEYLLKQRARNTLDVARSLRKFRRYFHVRDQIPLDAVRFPDTLETDLMNLFHISERVLNQIESESVMITISQLEIPFNGNK
jgi:hypothetical protein